MNKFLLFTFSTLSFFGYQSDCSASTNKDIYETNSNLFKGLQSVQSIAIEQVAYGDISDITGRRKTKYVEGYTKKNGTYVEGYYRS